MSIDAYKVAVRISLVENVTRGLAMMSRHFKATDADAKVLESRLKSIGKMAMVGGALAGAGFAGLRMLQGPLDEAKKYQEEMARFASLGFGAKVNAQADAYARGMQTIGTSTRDNMTLVSDAMAVFKNLDHAKMAAPIMARMKFANEALFGDAGKASDAKFMDLLKVIEFRGGLSSDAEFARQANFAQKVISGSRGRVDATAMLQALKTGGVALSRRDNGAFYLGSEPLIQEFGGSRYGTAAMSIYQNLVQSRGTVTAQQELYRLGLLDASKVQFNKLGQLKKALPGAFVGSSILENQGELALLQQVLLPAFAKAGITNPEMITREFGMILGNRTGSGLMARIFQQQPSLQRQIAANRNAYGINEMSNAAANTARGKEIDLEKKEANLKLLIGQQILPIYVRGLEMTAKALGLLISVGSKHPILTKLAVGAFVAVSAMAALGGSLLLVTAGFRAIGLALTIIRLPALLPLVSTGFTLIGGAIAAIGLPITLTVAALAGLGAAIYGIYTHWNQIKHFFGFGDSPSPSSSGVPGGTVRPSHTLSRQGGDVFLDGKKVGKVMAPYLLSNAAKGGAGPNGGSTGFNPALAPLRPATAR
jgi:hypothetical protein